MKGGILIIGSLLWDPDQGVIKNLRENWRNEHLDVPNKVKVYAPIRYGRKTNGYYTMVFSKDTEINNTLGTAYIVPFKNSIANYDDILKQARFLSNAEGSSDSLLIKGTTKWCVIGILFNPKLNQLKREDIICRHLTHLNSEGFSLQFNKFKIGNEESILKNTGEININWLNAFDPLQQNNVDEFDFVLATCPQPTDYPSSQGVKDLLPADIRNYFKTNNAHGITTFQDSEILN